MAQKKKNKTVSFGSQQLKEALKLVEQLSKPFADAPAATPAERRSLPRARPGVLAAVPKLARICAKVGLVLPSISLSDAAAQAEYADRVRQLWTSVAVLYQSLSDELLRVEGPAATTATAMYGMLVRASKKNTSLVQELEPVQAFFARRPKSTSEGSATQGAETSNTTSTTATGAKAETAATTSQSANASETTHP